MHDMHCHALAVRSPEWRKKNFLSCSSGTHRSCFVLRSHVPCIIQSFTSLMFLIHRLLFRLLTQTFTVILNDPAVFNLTPSNYPASSGVKMWFQDFFFCLCVPVQQEQHQFCISSLLTAPAENRQSACVEKVVKKTSVAPDWAARNFDESPQVSIQYRLPNLMLCAHHYSSIIIK